MPISPPLPVTLDAYQKSDQSSFLAWCADETAFRFLRKSLPGAPPPGELFEHLRQLSLESTQGNRVWAIRSSERELTGHLECKRTEKTAEEEGEVVVFVAPAFRRRHVATQAIRLLADRSIALPEFNRLLGVCRPDHQASPAILEAAGFSVSESESAPDGLWYRRDI